MSCSSNCVAPVGYCIKEHLKEITPTYAGYITGDVIGTSGSELITLSGAANPGSVGEITLIELIEQDTTLQKKGISFVFMDTTYITALDDAQYVFPPGVLLAPNFAGRYSIATADYSNIDNISVTKHAVARADLKIGTKSYPTFFADGSGNLYLNLVADEAITFLTPGKLFLRIHTRFHIT